MTRDDIIRMALEAGFNVDEKGAINDGIETAADFSDELKRFATLVAAAEREACCGPAVLNSAGVIGSDNPHQVYAKLCAAIRARGEKDAN